MGSSVLTRTLYFICLIIAIASIGFIFFAGELIPYLLSHGDERASWETAGHVAENITTPAYRATVTFYVRIAILVLCLSSAAIYLLRRSGLRVPVCKVDMVGITIWLLIFIVFILIFGYPISLFFGLMFL